MVKRHETEKENDKDDKAIDEYLQNDIKMIQQGHNMWTLTKSMQPQRYETDSQRKKGSGMIMQKAS